MDEQARAENGGRPVMGETCLCREAGRMVMELFRVPEATRQHLTNSRIEFLKAVRTLIDARIDTLSRAELKGSKVVVE